MDQNFIEQGITEVFDVSVEKELTDISNLIYENTRNFLIDHDNNLSLNEKINLNFKEVPDTKMWSKLMEKINTSNELFQIINSDGVKKAFKKVFKKPKVFDISTFRARLPDQKRVVYNWHQDEGTWFLSKNKKQLNKYPATLWFSINGASEKDSIQLLKFSHKQKLHNHTYISGQGYFNIAKKNFVNSNDILTVNSKPSQGIIFHPLTVHRSVPTTDFSLRPRYTIDIRYYDEDYKEDYKVDFTFKAKRFFQKIF